MEGDDYKKILEKEIHKEYKKITPNELKNVTKAQEKVVKNLELEDRVFETTQRQCFATVKDHKENFPNKVTARLINPMKPESGKISKNILENINNTIRSKTGLNQWKDTDDVLNWFEKIKNKRNKSFIQVDVVNFYPSISEKLLKEAIEWAKKFIDIPDEDIEVILESKNSIILNEGVPWSKIGDSNFDVAQGSFDGAECAELVGIFILADINSINTLNPGIYRDDFLAVTSLNPQQTENLKKQIVAKFSKYGLGTTAMEQNVLNLWEYLYLQTSIQSTH